MMPPPRRVSQCGEPIEWERGLRDRAHGDSYQHERVVVTGGAIRMQRIAAGAPVDEDPFAVTTDGDRDRFHRRTALRGAIAGTVVDVATPQAVGAMVPMSSAGRVVGDVESAVPAPERPRRASPRPVARIARHGDTSVVVTDEVSAAREGQP